MFLPLFVVFFCVSHCAQAAPLPEEQYEVVRFLGADDNTSRVVKSDSEPEVPLSTPLPPEKEEDDKYVEENEEKVKISEQFMMSEDEDSETAPPPLKDEDIPIALKTDTIDAKKLPDFVKDGKTAPIGNTSGGIQKGRKFEEATKDVIPFDSADFS